MIIDETRRYVGFKSNGFFLYKIAGDKNEIVTLIPVSSISYIEMERNDLSGFEKPWNEYPLVILNLVCRSRLVATFEGRKHHFIRAYDQLQKELNDKKFNRIQTNA